MDIVVFLAIHITFISFPFCSFLNLFFTAVKFLAFIFAEVQPSNPLSDAVRHQLRLRLITSDMSLRRQGA